MALTELTLAMDGSSSAPERVGAALMPFVERYRLHWTTRDDRAYVTLVVGSVVAETLIARLSRLHPTVRCIERRSVGDSGAVDTLPQAETTR